MENEREKRRAREDRVIEEAAKLSGLLPTFGIAFLSIVIVVSAIGAGILIVVLEKSNVKDATKLIMMIEGLFLFVVVDVLNDRVKRRESDWKLIIERYWRSKVDDLEIASQQHKLQLKLLEQRYDVYHADVKHDLELFASLALTATVFAKAVQMMEDGTRRSYVCEGASSYYLVQWNARTNDPQVQPIQLPDHNETRMLTLDLLGGVRAVFLTWPSGTGSVPWRVVFTVGDESTAPLELREGQRYEFRSGDTLLADYIVHTTLKDALSDYHVMRALGRDAFVARHTGPVTVVGKTVAVEPNNQLVADRVDTP